MKCIATTCNNLPAAFLWPSSSFHHVQILKLRPITFVEAHFIAKYDFLDRLKRVADLGIRGFEFWQQQNKDLEAIARVRDELGLTWVGMVGTSVGR